MSSYQPYLFLLLLTGSLQVFAQTGKTVTLATPFSYSLKQQPGTPAPVAGEKFGSFEVLKASPAAGGFELLLVAYDTGTFKLPGVDSTVSISVLAPAPIKDYAPPKEPLFTRKEAEYPLWIPLLVTSLALAIAFIYWLRNRKKTTPVQFAVQTPGGMGLLQEVKEGWLSGKLSSLELGDGLVNSLQAQFGLPVKKSTLQLVKEIKSSYPDACNTTVEGVLKNTDAWRFGKQSAKAEDGEAAIHTLEGLFIYTSQKANKQP